MTEFNLKELKYQRQRKDLTIREMAKKINMKPSAYQRESGKVKIKMSDFMKIVEVLEYLEMTY